MDAVIPPNVLEQLRELAQQSGDPLRGGWTTIQLARAMDLSHDAARDIVRRLMVQGLVTGRRVGISVEQAFELGYLGSCSIMVYHLKEPADG